MSKLSRFLRKAERKVSSVIPHTHSSERRAAEQAAEAQISYYQDLRAETDKARQEAETKKREEERKLAEKQVRALRRRRSRGFLSNQSSDAINNVSDKLG